MKLRIKNRWIFFCRSALDNVNDVFLLNIYILRIFLLLPSIIPPWNQSTIYVAVFRRKCLRCLQNKPMIFSIADGSSKKNSFLPRLRGSDRRILLPENIIKQSSQSDSIGLCLIFGSFSVISQHHDRGYSLHSRYFSEVFIGT